MAYQALYRKYRPSNFDEVVGQQHIIQTLKNTVYQDRIAHAYLFCGPRGTGKTSIAKIFAKMLNCTDTKNRPCGHCDNCEIARAGNHPDIIEIDAASNNGVEEVRNLIDKIKYAPLHGKYKVYIIDEVHMMSSGAFNALLKTIEEPPEHVIFIFATTEPNKVIPTIISRCQRFDFTKVSDKDIQRRLRIVCKSENIEIDDDALELIAKLADGGMRDSLSILDQCVAYCISNITAGDVRDIYGVLNTNDIVNLFNYIYKNEVDTLMNCLQNYSNKGIDLQRMFSDMIHLIKDSIIVEYSPNTTLVTPSNKEIINQTMVYSNVNFRLDLLNHMMDVYSKFSYASNVLDYIQTCFLSIISKSYEPKTEPKNMNSYTNQEQIKSDNTNKSYDEPSEKSDITDKMANLSVNQAETIDNEPSDVSRETSLKEENNDEEIILNDEFLLQLLVGANKSMRQSDGEKMKSLNQYMTNLNYAKFAVSLRNVTIVASSETYLVVSVSSRIEAKQINDYEIHEGYEKFMNEILGTPKKVFAIDHKHQKDIIELYKKRSAEHTLPEPCKVDVNMNSETKLKSKEEHIKEIFPTLEIKKEIGV